MIILHHHPSLRCIISALITFYRVMIFSLILNPLTLVAQSNGLSTISGTIYHQSNGEKLPYVNVYNLTTKTGVLSNENGFFQLEQVASNDSVRFSYIGFKAVTFTGNQLQEYSRIMLVSEFREMKEVTVVADDQSFLYDLIYKAGRRMNGPVGKAKTYFELKSYNGDVQIELVEGYYGAELSGSELQSLDLKTVRFGLRPYQNRFFVSHENAKAIAMNKLLFQNPFFPAQPFAFSLARMRKEFSLILFDKYRDETGDSVYVIRYIPRNKNKESFNGEIWLNVTRLAPSKMTMNGTTATHHPFQPMFSVDSILKVQFSITRTFDLQENIARFKHIDFNIDVSYKSIKPNQPVNITTVSSRAVLFAYEYDTTFFQPYFRFNYLPDFRKFNAYPYEEEFWRQSREYGMQDSLNRNKYFFDNEAVLNSNNAYVRNAVFSTGLYEHPFIHWSTNRFVIKRSEEKPELKISQLKTDRERYEVNVELFLDLIPKGDSMELFTVVMFDPYRSYYHFDQDSLSVPFYNMVLDLYEIQRRKHFPERMIHKDQQQDLADRIKLFEEEGKRAKEQYFKDVQRGRQIQEMKWYHRLIKKELGVLSLPE